MTRSKSFIISLCCVYLTFLLMFFVWTLVNLWSRWEQLIEPVSSSGFTIQQFDQLFYPAIKICNFLPGIKLEHKKCKNLEDELNCDYTKEEETTEAKSIFDDESSKKRYCLTYNTKIDNAFVANKNALQDMFIISLSININDYPLTSFLSGVRISLHPQGKKHKVYSSNIIVTPGKFSLIRLKKVTNEYLNGTIFENYEPKMSSLGNQNFEKHWGYKNDTVVIAFQYQDMNVMVIKELTPYNLMSFLSETGGMLGLLIGTSLVNLITLVLQWGWGLRFNEINWANVMNKNELKKNSQGEIENGNNTSSSYEHFKNMKEEENYLLEKYSIA